jgi:hypothetical protein
VKGAIMGGKPKAMSRWRSRTVVLVVLGAGAAVAGCSREADSQKRNGYATREACLRDYSPEQCREERTSNGGMMIFGPWYMANRARALVGDPGPGATAVNGQSQAASTGVQTRRSGFGATGRSAGFRGG